MLWNQNILKFALSNSFKMLNFVDLFFINKILDKVEKVEISLEKQLVNVETVLSQEEILEALKKTGKEVSVTTQ